MRISDWSSDVCSSDLLVFFLLMLMAGAALGLWSLYADNRAMRQLAANQAISRTLNESVIQYKNIQASLGRALASYVANNDRQQYAIDRKSTRLNSSH